jgi:hypothetical protein
MVEAIDGSNNPSSPSNFDIATTIVFTDDSVVAGTTTIKALHFTQLRTAIDDVRATKGQPPATYTNAIAPGGLIKLIDMMEMRSFLNAIRADLSLPAIQYVNPTLHAGDPVKAADIQDLRSGVK